MSLLDWSAQALPKCADNIVAETYGAGLAISLYEKYRNLCQQQSLMPLPLDRIQGDIKPLLQHLDFRGRFRRSDLVTLVNQFHAKRSRIAPNSITEYRPREANTLADYFAGQASSYLRDMEGSHLLNDTPLSLPVDPPYDLLLQANAVILGPHRDGKTMLILQELPGCDMLQMARFACWSDGKCAAAVKAIALATKKCTAAMSVEYIAAASDGKGRLYARQCGAQALPRSLRLLLYGNTHKEVDMSGSHYELTRAVCASQTLPPIRELRQWLRPVWAARLASEETDDVQKAVKLFPIRVINSGAVSALSHLGALGLDTPSWIPAFAYELEAARNAATAHILTVIRPRLEVAFRNRHFYAAEAIEGIVMQLFLLEVRKRCFTPSIIWLHDGFWIDKQVDDRVLAAAEKHVRSLLFPASDAEVPLFQVVDLSGARDLVLLSCPYLPSSPLFSNPLTEISIADVGKRSHTRMFPVAKFVHRKGSKRKVPAYLSRIRKRARRSWLR